ncbi:MAG: geopeptide radical SAM maturase [Nitrospiraceae bacterium]|nr:geopeptide radical SAM maturase [Nitrospiraceae bacterium]
MDLSRYLRVYPAQNPRNVILYSTKNAAIVELPKKMADRLPDVDLSEEDRKILRQAGFIVKDAEKEKRQFLTYIDELNSLNNSLSIKLVMNLDCNLACRYCFEGKRKGSHYMTKKTADDFIGFVKETIRRRKDIKGILITYYGGEPLLSRELIISISERLKSFADDKGLRLKLFFTTNGTLLTKETVKRLKPLGLKEALVTLDGPSDIHNSFRPFRSGRGSFDTIVKNIKAVSSQVAIALNGNFVKDNYRRFPALLDYLNAEGVDIPRLQSVQFSPVVSESEDFGPGFHEGCASISEPWFPVAAPWLREEILKRKGRQSRTGPGLCMMEYENNILVNYDGGIYKCPGLIGRKEYVVGDIWSGLEDYRVSHNLGNWKNDECLGCAYLPLCFGGCRYMKLVRDGDMNGVDCRKEFFDATLEAFVNQDMKYGLAGG